MVMMHKVSTSGCGEPLRWPQMIKRHKLIANLSLACNLIWYHKVLHEGLPESPNDPTITTLDLAAIGDLSREAGE